MAGGLETDEEVGGWAAGPSEITFILIVRTFCICFEVSLEKDIFLLN